jgi:hypothetical protein
MTNLPSGCPGAVLAGQGQTHPDVAPWGPAGVAPAAPGYYAALTIQDGSRAAGG